MPLDPEKAKELTSSLRKGIKILIEGSKASVSSEDRDIFFSPASVATVLLLSAWDYSLGQGLSDAQFIEFLEKIAEDLRVLTINDPNR